MVPYQYCGALQIIIVLGLTYGIGSSRVIRGAVIGVMENAYFEAAQAVGSPPWRTVLRHVLPNVLAPIIVIFSITVGAVIITEASLSFLGFGLPLNVPIWGGLLSREGRNYMQQAPWLAMWPGIFLTIVVYAWVVERRAARHSPIGCGFPPRRATAAYQTASG